MTSSRSQWITAATVFVLFAAILVFWGRCVWINHDAALAKVRVENRSPASWRIEISTTDGTLVRELHLGGWERATVSLKDGDYRFVQTLIDEQGGDGAIRVFDATFKSGKVYEWPLLTLLSPAAEPAKGGSR